MGKRTVGQAIKTAIKREICRIAYTSGIFHIYMKFGFLKRKSFPAVIINYQRFVNSLGQTLETNSTVTHMVRDLEREVLFLKRYFEVVTLDYIVQSLKAGKVFSKPTVAITVDDGYRDNFDYLFPVLKENGLTATVFLTTGVIGTNKRLWISRIEDAFLKTSQKQLVLGGIFDNKIFAVASLEERRASFLAIIQELKNIPTVERDRYLGDIERQLGSYPTLDRFMLSWEEVRVMEKGGIHFGAHTVNHPILTQLGLEDAKREIRKSKEEIEQHLGKDVKHFAFPNGRPQDFNEELRKYCQAVGFESVSSCDYGANDNGQDVWNLKRIGSEVPLSLYAFNVVRAFQG